MKRLLVTGATGFVGKIIAGMADEIAQIHGWTLLAAPAAYDLLDPASLDRLLQPLQPDGVIHLAGQSFVPAALKDPERTLQVNLVGTLNLLQALKRSSFHGSFIYVSSSDVYGHVDPADLPLTENQPVRPHNPYAMSKAAAELLCGQWSRVEPWRIVIARPFNHIGPGQRSEFVVPSIARALARIRLGLDEPRLQVGDIDVTRDFLDVRDVVRAYLGLLSHGENGGIYNVCSGRETRIRDLVDHLTRLSGIAVDIVQEPARLRPSDQRQVRGDNTRLRATTGWQPCIPLEQSLGDVLAYWTHAQQTSTPAGRLTQGLPHDSLLNRSASLP
jgi:GDP-4-dehydro-6-deoxy-D-mannose reductase